MSNIDDKQVRRMFDDMEDIVEDVMRQATTYMKSKTPVRSGNARSKTNLKGKTTILANYDYADRLDNGWSKQAPDGFTEPTIDEIEKQIYRAIGRL